MMALAGFSNDELNWQLDNLASLVTATPCVNFTAETVSFGGKCESSSETCKTSFLFCASGEVTDETDSNQFQRLSRLKDTFWLDVVVEIGWNAEEREFIKQIEKALQCRGCYTKVKRENVLLTEMNRNGLMLAPPRGGGVALEFFFGFGGVWNYAMWTTFEREKLNIVKVNVSASSFTLPVCDQLEWTC
jgi:hypothetical protein